MQPQATVATLADVTGLLAERFHGRITEEQIARMVRHCNRELIITTGTAQPIATLQLAGKRLAPRT